MRRHVFVVCAMASLLLTTASISCATSNLNLSKSNINRLVWDPHVVTPAQAAAILSDLDRAGGNADEPTIHAIVGKHLGAVKSAGGQSPIIRIQTSNAGMPTASARLGRHHRVIFILGNAADENEAARIAVGDPGPDDPPLKPTKKSTK